MANQLVPSSSFTTTPSWTYDVFLSFRGEDTRYNFTDHLYQALVRHGIHTFIDHSELPIGEEIAPTLLEAIENSRISVIIFSENYASSRWCLDELVHILECRKSRGQMTRAIFYKVDPSDVRHQRNSYGAAFADHSRKYENNLEKVQRWRTTLTEAADLKGATLNNGEYETTFINGIVKEISTQVLNRTYLHVAKYPVGIESCVEKVEELLGVGENDRRVVGIWGTSGIGKTTIAKAVHNAIAHKFQGSCFLADVRERSTSREGIIELQKRLLSKILCGTEFQIDSYHEGISLIKNRLSQKKILLILDDVDHLKQLDNLVQEISWFGEGSRVIITTKDRGLLDSYRVKLVYEVQTLEEGKALELLLLNAFGSNEPPKDYLRLARRAIAYAQGLPLALNIIGSHLCDKRINRWQAILDGYNSYDGEPYTDIQEILRKTYDAWDYGLQQVFLDIACFFKGGDKEEVLQILRSSKLGARQDCIEVLVEKAIITIEDNWILMHDLLEKMGKHIVWQESPYEPGERSRLWFHKDVYDVLTENKGTEKIRSIVVELPKSDVIPLNPESFLRMGNLEILINRNAHFSGCVNYLPNSLRWFDLGGRSIINIKHTVVLNLQSNFHPRYLVKFDMSYSDIRQLKGFKILEKLTWMNLSGCEFLEKIPDFSGSPNLKHLNLSGCKNLVEVDDFVGFLDKLVILDLSRCSKLTRFATRLELRSLEELNLCGCTRLERFPEIEKDKMKSLTRLEIGKSGIRELPSSIAYLTGLTELVANGCELQNVPDLSRSPNIRVLDLSDCTSLVEVHDSVGFLGKLEFLHLNGCSKLTRFATRLGLRSLIGLYLKGCTRLETFPEIEKDKMNSLTRLEIGKSGIRELPSSIAYLTGLTDLVANGCELQNVPDLSGSPNIMVLDLRDCTSLVEVHDSVGFLDKLEFLHLNGCSKLTRFVTRLGLRSLIGLYLKGCTRLETFPEIEKDKMKSLTRLEIGKSGIRELPSSIAYLTGLTHLSANGCELQNVPDLSGNPNISYMDLSDCTSLVEVHDSVGFLDKLEFLHLDGCSKLTRFATRLESRSLYYLSLEGCRRLESFPEIEGKMESLSHLNIQNSGIRELPSSIAYLTGLTHVTASGCELQNIQLLPFGKKVKFDEVSSCGTNLQLSLDLEGCNLSERDFLAPLDCWSALTSLNLSRNNFVSLPNCISKVVNLKTLFLRDCKRLREIPVLPPKLEELYLDDCTSLEKIPKLPLRLKRLNLCNCSGLSGDELAKLENNLLNEAMKFQSGSAIPLTIP
ncbi:disease resistance protein RUN1-like isoform X2 [Pyrus x bretschneideri]|uniref:disease resistance protein RUN1-like isoform X2 n=1 Tax=Pyrus x bretschneideri TaxID=225117 RepID=UPI00202ECC10|nr:disease resistance protein RUN1-like isoform X2 [Pyrus x bretschneideri]